MLFAAYGLCFAIQNKISSLWKIGFLNVLLTCTFCLGFHCGWLIYSCTWLLDYWQFDQAPFQWAQALNFAFGGAAWCYGVDAMIKWLEGDE